MQSTVQCSRQTQNSKYYPDASILAAKTCQLITLRMRRTSYVGHVGCSWSHWNGLSHDIVINSEHAYCRPPSEIDQKHFKFDAGIDKPHSWLE